jgi:uncharacterized membrane protein YsdA (DUF1294 family)
MLAQLLLLGHLTWQVIAGLVTFASYVWDKRQAKKNGWRIPERRLHLLAAIGGWAGAIVGQKWVRHKSQKLSFKILTALAMLVHVAITIGLAYWWAAGSG